MSDHQSKMQRLQYFLKSCDNCHGYIEDIDAVMNRIKELEALAFRSYCAGYERGHNDTVESHYAPPVEYPEEWAEILNDLQVEPPIEQEEE